MTIRQALLKFLYPLLMRMAKIGQKGGIYENKQNIHPPIPFYELKAELNDGQALSFATLKGKKVLVVNTASDCGFTGQYEELQKLWEQHQKKLIILGFPADDFKGQEKGSDQEIAQFCQRNYGVTFPLMKKSQVIKGSEQHSVFRWLTDASKNGWNNQAPHWNFNKYMINEKGMLTHCFGSAVSPQSHEIVSVIQA